MRRLLVLAAVCSIAVALLILVAPAAAIGRLAGIAPAETLLQGGAGASYVLFALTRLIAGLLIVIACLMLGTPTSWLVGGAGALLAVLLVVVARPAPVTG